MDTANLFYAFSMFPNEFVKMKYTFYNHDTGEELQNYKGIWNWENLNGSKTLTLSDDGNASMFDNLYLYDKNSVDPDKDATSDVKNTMQYSLIEENSISVLGDSFGNNYSDSVRLTQLLHKSMAVKYEPNLTGEVPADETEEAKEKRIQGYDTMYANYLNNIYTNYASIRAIAILGYSTVTIPRVAPSIPAISGETNDEADEQNKNYHKLKYSIIETIADNSIINRDSKFELKTNLPKGYSISESETTVEILNEIDEEGNNKDGKDLFNIKQSNDNKTLTLTAKDPASDGFVGNVLKINVVATRDDPSVNKSDDRFKAIDGAIADGYLHYELGKNSTVVRANDNSATTKINYTYGDEIDEEQTAPIDDGVSEAKVRHLSELSFDTESKVVPKKTNVTEMYDDASIFISAITVPDLEKTYKDDELDALVKNRQIKVAYKNSSIVTNDIAGAKTEFDLVVTLIENDLERTFTTTASVYNEGAYKVKLLGSQKEDGEVIEDITIYSPQNEPINLKENSIIQDTIKKLKDELGYEKVNYYSEENNNQPEESYVSTKAEDIIIYRVTDPGLQIVIPSEATFDSGVVNPGIEQDLRYNGSEDFTIKVKDLRTYQEDKASNARNGRGKLEIQAYRDPFKKEDDSKKTLTNISLYWQKDTITDVIPEGNGDRLTVYKNETIVKDPKEAEVNLTLRKKVDNEDETRLGLKVGKGSNMEASSYESTIYWELIYAP